MVKITSGPKTSYLYSELPHRSPSIPLPVFAGNFILVDRSCAQGYIPWICGQKPVNRV